jgi:hypothetical protein
LNLPRLFTNPGAWEQTAALWAKVFTAPRLGPPPPARNAR